MNNDSGVELRFKSPMSTTSAYKFTKEQEEKRRTLAQDLQNKYFGQDDILQEEDFEREVSENYTLDYSKTVLNLRSGKKIKLDEGG